MAQENRVQYWNRMVNEQEQFIIDNGNTLEGYIERYGDPDKPRANGLPMTGDGGTVIYHADREELSRRLKRLDEAQQIEIRANGPGLRVSSVTKVLTGARGSAFVYVKIENVAPILVSEVSVDQSGDVCLKVDSSHFSLVPNPPARSGGIVPDYVLSRTQHDLLDPSIKGRYVWQLNAASAVGTPKSSLLDSE